MQGGGLSEVDQDPPILSWLGPGAAVMTPWLLACPCLILPGASLPARGPTWTGQGREGVGGTGSTP